MKTSPSFITGGGVANTVLRLRENPNWYFLLTFRDGEISEQHTIECGCATRFDKSAVDNLFLKDAYREKYEPIELHYEG